MPHLLIHAPLGAAADAAADETKRAQEAHRGE